MRYKWLCNCELVTWTCCWPHSHSNGHPIKWDESLCIYMYQLVNSAYVYAHMRWHCVCACVWFDVYMCIYACGVCGICGIRISLPPVRFLPIKSQVLPPVKLVCDVVASCFKVCWDCASSLAPPRVQWSHLDRSVLLLHHWGLLSLYQFCSRTLYALWRVSYFSNCILYHLDNASSTHLFVCVHQFIIIHTQRYKRLLVYSSSSTYILYSLTLFS